MLPCFQVERVLDGPPLRVAGRVIEGTIAVGDVLRLGSNRYRVVQADVFGHLLDEVTAGTVAALWLERCDGPQQNLPQRGDHLVKDSG